MRFGVMLGAQGPNAGVKDVVAAAQRIETAGFDDIWMANIFAHDAISMLTLIGYLTKRVGLGTAVTPTYPRHPTAIAQQALTAAAASGNRFTLGIGLSHQPVIENMLGLSYAKPARHMREYLSVLAPALRGETISYQGEEYRVQGLRLQVSGAGRVPVIVAALGPVMLKLAGEMADGTTTWMTGPKTLESHIIKRIRAAAAAAGRGEPAIVGGFPVVLTNNPDEVRERLARSLVVYGQLASYRAMLDREGVKGPADIAIVGDERVLRHGIAHLRDIGVTHFNAAISETEEGAYERTFAFLGDLRREI
jgi:5,10-methylenetetrahydromethanopterin reductase